MNFLSRFAKDESGATAIEYGLIAGFISIVIIAALQLIKPEMSRIFGAVATGLQDAKP
jgi:pilus assembly protein Flp/PilA